MPTAAPRDPRSDSEVALTSISSHRCRGVASPASAPGSVLRQRGGGPFPEPGFAPVTCCAVPVPVSGVRCPVPAPLCAPGLHGEEGAGRRVRPRWVRGGAEGGGGRVRGCVQHSQV